MYLQKIDIRTPYKSINIEGWCIEEHYWHYLRQLKYQCNKYYKVNIHLSNNQLDKDNELTNEIKGFPSITKIFDFEKYSISDVYNKKKMLLDVMYEAMILLAENSKCEILPLKQAYSSCIKDNLEYKWWLKNKFFQSPDRKHYGRFFCEWKTDRFLVDAVLYDIRKNEIFKKNIINIEAHWGEFIYRTKVNWEDNCNFTLQEGNLKWLVSIMKDNMIDTRLLELDKNSYTNTALIS